MEHKILGTPQKRRRIIVPGLVEELNKECSEAENQSLEQKSSASPKRIILDIADICRGYEEFMGWKDKIIEIPTQIIGKYSPTKQQVLEFSKMLINYKDLDDFILDSSNYLTALMHSSEEKGFEIDLQELNKQNILLGHLGYELKNKILVVNGSAGDFVGSHAENSKITIKGSAGDYVGCFVENSKITINGNAGNYVGNNARNSEITINGHAENSIGGFAENSEIYVRGNIGSISDNLGGSKIFQFKDKKWVEVRG